MQITGSRTNRCTGRLSAARDPDVLSLPDGQVLEGELPPAKMRLLLAWVEIHKDELLADWELAVSGQQPYKIEPLR